MNTRQYVTLALAILAGILIGNLVSGLIKRNVSQGENTQVGSIFVERTSYNTIGTASVSSTLTGSYDGNSSTMFAENLENLHLDVQYRPNTTDAYALILIEGSNDGGITYFPLTTKTINTSTIDMNVDGASSTMGVPVVFPGDQTSVAGTTLLGMFDTDIVASWVRVSASEVGGTTAGTIYVRSTLTSKK